ncbi:putative caspase [Hypoxylon sp. NC0597]|nr:putative caspase [Hypoxylon sp. NC0597]
MGDPKSVVAHHAILIGINSYKDKPLEGCVQDIQEIKRYLENNSKSTRIETFTAPSSNRLGLPSQEDLTTWPTYENVTNALGRVIRAGRRGDCVYIHYSGHGTRGTPSSEFSNRSTGDLALVLFSGGKDNDIRYLWGSRLAFSIKAMVDKGLVVTLVLDCCFSATVYRRDDPNVRFLQFDPKIDYMYPPEIFKREVDPGDSDQPDRDTSMSPNWLINPDGYAILVACGPHELAIERRFNGGPKHGALSYFLLTTLADHDGLEMAHKDIYDHVCALFRENQLRHHPILYGNKNQGFFGYTNPWSSPTIPILARSDGKLELQAGVAHGVSDGDQFALWPLGSVREDARNSVVAKVVCARGLVSDLERLELNSIGPQTGWIATALTRFSLRQFTIRLGSSLPNQSELLRGLQERSLGVHSAADSNCSFYLTLNDSGRYEVLDEFNKIVDIPVLLPSQTEDDKVCDILEHLARYNLVRELANNREEGDSFRESFKAQIISRTREHFNPGILIETKQDETSKFNFELQVENKGTNDIYVYVYNLGPYKQIQNILRGTYEVVPAVNRAAPLAPLFKKKVKTTIPAEMIEKGHRHCEDIIKVFVTSQPTSFDILEIGKIGSESAKKKFISRAGKGDISCSPDWNALNFYIRTSL